MGNVYQLSLPIQPQLPARQEGTASGDYSWTLSVKSTDPSGLARNFIYVSVIPAGFQSQGGEIYNYNTPEADLLLNMEVGESGSLHGGDDPQDGFTFTRQPDVVLDDLTVKVYRNVRPWEFPEGTQELRYYVQTDTATYLLGGYIDSTGTNPPGAITEALFHQIIATCRLLR